MCNNFESVHSRLSTPWATVDKRFMDRLPNATLTPLPFCLGIDFKHMWLVDGDTQPELREFLFETMSSLFVNSYAIFKLTHSPDIDITVMSKLIVDAIVTLRKQIPRCDRAFDQIERSAAMLETKFPTYYGDYLETNDANNIFTNFLSDVTGSCSSDPMLIFQCRRIVQYYKSKNASKLASGKKETSKMAMMAKIIGGFETIERRSAADHRSDGEQAGSVDDTKDGSSTPDPDDDAPGLADEVPTPDDRSLDDLMAAIDDPRAASAAQPKAGKRLSEKKNAGK